MPKRILIIAGEASGDLYGAHLVSALKRRYPEAEFSGVGGARMKASGVEIIYPIDELSIIGLVEVFPKIKVIKGLFGLLRNKIKKDKIDLAILVNYPGFNLKFAKVLKKAEIPVVFYSSPQVWAWGKWRINGIKKFVDKMIVLLKFEEEFYKKNGVEASFVGHPLVDIVKPQGDNLGIKKNNGLRVISLVPGSRKTEVKNLLFTMLETAKIIYAKDKNVQFLVTKHPQLRFEMYQGLLEKYKLPLKVIDGKIYDCLNISCLAITVSGSVTLEAAIMKIPMIIINRLSFITAFLFFIFVRLANVGLVNIIAGKRIVPELLQYQATPQNIAKEVFGILSNKNRYEKMKEDLGEVNTLIGQPGASGRAAKIISKLLE